MPREGALDDALTSPQDEQLFYNASIHFLKKRLQEKSPLTLKSRNTTQSCCNFTTDEKLPPIELRRESLREINYTAPESPLPMHQVLPFPKSSNNFMVRLKNRFRKMRHCWVRSETGPSVSKPARRTSEYRFPRCERPGSGLFAPDLVVISEEPSQETVLQSRRKSTLYMSDSESGFLNRNNENNKPK